MTRAASVIALAIGDPNGIGPEIAVKAAARLASDSALRVVLVGDAHVIRWYAQRCAFSLDSFDILNVDALPVDAFKPGEVSAAAGAATLAYVRAALDLARAGHADAVIACPHSETAINASGTMASPIGSVFQIDSVALRLRWNITWGLRAAGVAWMSSVNW